MNAHTILIAVAFVCELLAAAGIPQSSVNLMALGLAFFFLSLLVG